MSFYPAAWHAPQFHCTPANPACRYVPTAVLSRQTAGLRGKSLIINLPGKPKSIRETFDEVGGRHFVVVWWLTDIHMKKHLTRCM